MDAAYPQPVDPALIGARIQAVQQPDERTVVLETHRSGAGAARWVLSLHAELARFGRSFVRRKRARGGPPPVFCQWLRTRLEGGRIAALGLRHPQIVELTVESPGGTTHVLVLELNRRDSNLLLLDGEGRLLIALRHPTLPGRKLGPGEPYRPPPRLHPWPRTTPLAERLPAPDEASARALERTWQVREGALALAERRAPALQAVRRERKRLERRLAKLDADRDAALEAERWRHYGELLQIERAHLRQGLDSIEVRDVFEPGQPTVTIPLDPHAEPGENIERCFRRFRKARDAAPHVAARIAETRGALAQWEALQARLDAAGDAPALEALAADLPPGAERLRALLRAPASRPARGKGARGAGQDGREPMRRRSAEGYLILVGRSKEENDRVTFRLGRGRDWWLHAQGIAGSHVLVVNPSGEALPRRTLREAAWLAGYYSQARAAGRVEVDYTQRKHVRKIKGAEPGQVTYSGNKSLLVELDDAALRQVLERTEEE